MEHLTHPVGPPARTATVGVRQATVRDLGAVLELRLALLREYPDHPIYGRLKRDISARALALFRAQLQAVSEAIFLAESAGRAVGVLRIAESIASPLLEPSRYAYVSSVYVKPENRRQGVLRALVKAADSWSRQRGIEQMRLHNVAGSDSAEGAWGALGFEVVEQVRLRNLSRR